MLFSYANITVPSGGRSPLYSSTSGKNKAAYSCGYGSHFLYRNDYWSVSWLLHSLLTMKATSLCKFCLLTNFGGVVMAWREVDFLLSVEEHHTNRSSSTLRVPSLLFTANNIKVMTAMSNAQERHKSASHFLIQLHCEKTSRVAQFKGRFSDFVSNFLPFVVPSWRLHNT